jgi:hypothetical protein
MRPAQFSFQAVSFSSLFSPFVYFIKAVHLDIAAQHLPGGAFPESRARPHGLSF